MNTHEIDSLPPAIRDHFRRITDDELPDTPEIAQLKKRLTESNQEHARRASANHELNLKIDELRKKSAEAVLEIARLQAARPAAIANALLEDRGLGEDAETLERIAALSRFIDAVKVAEPLFAEKVAERMRETSSMASESSSASASLKTHLDVLRLAEAKRRAL